MPPKKFLTNALMMFVICFIGSLFMLIFLLFLSAGMIIIKNRRAIPRLKPGMRIFANHPDAFNCMFEIVAVVSLFLSQAFFHPLKFAPKIPVDKNNFVEPWYWAWFEPFAIPIVRSKEKNPFREAREMLGVLAAHKLLLHFIEPGRTCTGKEFIWSKSGKNCIRKVPDTVGLLISRSEEAPIVLVWVDNGEIVPQPGKSLWGWPNFSKPITIGFVEVDPRQFIGKKLGEIRQLVVDEMLRLADRTTQG